LVEDFFS
jgi:hypothetical protein